MQLIKIGREQEKTRKEKKRQEKKRQEKKRQEKARKEKKRKEKKSKEKKRKDKKKKKQAWVCMSGEGAGNSRYLRDVLVSGASEEVDTRDVVPRKRGRQGLHIQVFMGQR